MNKEREARERELMAEIESLRSRLTEPEETLEAIRLGKVDAFVVTESAGERVYVLKDGAPPYRLMVEEMKEGAATLTPDGVILYANRSLAMLLESSREMLRGSLFREFVAEEDRDGFQMILAGRRGGRGAVLLRTARGAEFPAQISATVFTDDHVPLVCFIVTDVREQRRFAALEESERRARHLASIVESSEDSIIGIDLQGRILDWNHSAERLFGYRRDEAIGQSIEILMSPDAPEDWRRNLKRVAEGERVKHYETRRRARDGRILDVSLTVSPVRDAGGLIVGASKVARDITAERAARRENEKTRELFLGILSHDLRNPLNAITIAAYTLGRKAAGADRKTVERISKATERMTRMIDQLLDLTQTRLGGGFPIRREETNLARLCEAVAEEFETLHPGRIRLTADAELKGQWDADRIVQALSNLVSNALQHGAAESAISIRASGRGEVALLEVTNQGPPIPASLLPVVFDPFRRGETGGQEGVRGLGLGLFIAREIVRTHGGEITVRSGPTEGTTFSIALPLRPTG